MQVRDFDPRRVDVFADYAWVHRSRQGSVRQASARARVNLHTSFLDQTGNGSSLFLVPGFPSGLRCSEGEGDTARLRDDTPLFAWGGPSVATAQPVARIEFRVGGAEMGTGQLLRSERRTARDLELTRLISL
jgi:hypothetical protein